jgi:hypothetical protein
MFELTWIYDEIFVKRELYDRVFKKAGVDCWPVLLFKKETLIECTVQLKIPQVETPMAFKNHPYEVCNICKRKKYRPRSTQKNIFEQKNMGGTKFYICYRTININ